jgi:hypothetical protein
MTSTASAFFLLRHLARLVQDLAIVVVIISIDHYEVLRFNGRSAPFNGHLRCGAPIDSGRTRKKTGNGSDIANERLLIAGDRRKDEKVFDDDFQVAWAEWTSISASTPSVGEINKRLKENFKSCASWTPKWCQQNKLLREE